MSSWKCSKTATPPTAFTTGTASAWTAARASCTCEESLLSINFDDVEPAVTHPEGDGVLADCEFFHVEKWSLADPRTGADERRFAIFAVVEGTVTCGGREFGPGRFFLVPPGLPEQRRDPGRGGSGGAAHDHSVSSCLICAQCPGGAHGPRCIAFVKINSRAASLEE